MGWDVCGYVTSLGFDDRQSRQRTTTFHDASLLEAFGQVVHALGNRVVIDDFGGAFEQAAVKVKYVTGVGLTSRRTTKEERYFTLSDGLLGDCRIYTSDAADDLPRVDIGC